MEKRSSLIRIWRLMRTDRRLFWAAVVLLALMGVSAGSLAALAFWPIVNFVNAATFDTGGFIGSAIGVVAAVIIATNQFKKEDDRLKTQMDGMQRQIKATRDLWSDQVRREEFRAALILLNMADRVTDALFEAARHQAVFLAERWSERRKAALIPWADADGRAMTFWSTRLKDTDPMLEFVAKSDMVFSLPPDQAAQMHAVRTDFRGAIELVKDDLSRYSNDPNPTDLPHMRRIVGRARKAMGLAHQILDLLISAATTGQPLDAKPVDARFPTRRDLAREAEKILFELDMTMELENESQVRRNGKALKDLRFHVPRN